MDERLIVALRDEQFGHLGVGWSADSIVLYRSHLGQTGSSYEALHATRLDNRKAAARRAS